MAKNPYLEHLGLPGGQFLVVRLWSLFFPCAKFSECILANLGVYKNIKSPEKPQKYLKTYHELKEYNNFAQKSESEKNKYRFLNTASKEPLILTKSEYYKC
jgi:hypothetical protein